MFSKIVAGIEKAKTDGLCLSYEQLQLLASVSDWYEGFLPNERPDRLVRMAFPFGVTSRKECNLDIVNGKLSR